MNPDEPRHPSHNLEEIARAFGVPESKIQLIGVAPVKPITLQVPLEVVVFEPTQPRPTDRARWRDPWAVVSLGAHRLGTFQLDRTGSLVVLDDIQEDATPVGALPASERLPADIEGTVFQALSEAQVRAYRIRAAYYTALAENSGTGQ